MSLSGLHVTCRFGGVFDVNGKQLQVIGKPEWGQTMASAGTTTNSAPDYGVNKGDQAIFRVVSSEDAWVAIGQDPDAEDTDGSRDYVQAFVEYDFSVNSGDKLAWVAA